MRRSIPAAPSDGLRRWQNLGKPLKSPGDDGSMDAAEDVPPSGPAWPKDLAREKGPSSWYGKRRDVASDHRILCLAGSWFEKVRAGVGMTQLELRVHPMG